MINCTGYGMSISTGVTLPLWDYENVKIKRIKIELDFQFEVKYPSEEIALRLVKTKS